MYTPDDLKNLVKLITAVSTAAEYTVACIIASIPTETANALPPTASPSTDIWSKPWSRPHSTTHRHSWHKAKIRGLQLRFYVLCVFSSSCYLGNCGQCLFIVVGYAVVLLMLSLLRFGRSSREWSNAASPNHSLRRECSDRSNTNRSLPCPIRWKKQSREQHEGPKRLVLYGLRITWATRTSWSVESLDSGVCVCGCVLVSLFPRFLASLLASLFACFLVSFLACFQSQQQQLQQQRQCMCQELMRAYKMATVIQNGH